MPRLSSARVVRPAWRDPIPLPRCCGLAPARRRAVSAPAAAAAAARAAGGGGGGGGGPSPSPPPSPPPPPQSSSSSSSSSFARLREVEVLHARWAMLGVSALVLSDSPFRPLEAWRAARDALAALGGAGAVLPAAAVCALAAIEAARVSGERDAERRAYPAATERGNALFDPLGLFRETGGGGGGGKTAAAKGRHRLSVEEASRVVYAPWLRGSGGLSVSRRRPGQPITRAELGELQGRELAAGRAAIVGLAGVVAASGLTGRGPVSLLLEHLSDPPHATVVQTLMEQLEQQQQH